MFAPMKKEDEEGDVLVSQFIIHEKRSKEHLTPRRPDIGGPINDKDDDVSFAILFGRFFKCE